MDVNSLPKIVTRQRCSCDLNPGPSAPESSTLTTAYQSVSSFNPSCGWPCWVQITNHTVRNDTFVYTHCIDTFILLCNVLISVKVKVRLSFCLWISFFLLLLQYLNILVNKPNFILFSLFCLWDYQRHDSFIYAFCVIIRCHIFAPFYFLLKSSCRKLCSAFSQCFDNVGWVAGREGIRPVKTESWGAGTCGVVVSVWNEVQTCIWPSWCHCHSLSFFSKIQIAFTFLVLAQPGSPGKGPLNGCCCCYLV